MAPGSRSMTACRPQADMRKAPRGRRAVKVAAAALSWFFTPSTLGLPVRATAQPAVEASRGVQHGHAWWSRIPPMSITDSTMSITDSTTCRSPCGSGGP